MIKANAIAVAVFLFTLAGIDAATAEQAPRVNAEDVAQVKQDEIAQGRPPIVTRQDWGARPPGPGMIPQQVSAIILHNTGVRQNLQISLEQKMRNLQSFSQRPGTVSPRVQKPAWPDVPYHFYIDAKGRIAEGRDPAFAGDTNTNYNTIGYIQIVVEGDFEQEMPGPEQMAALRDLLVWVLRTRGLGVESISVHSAHAPTDCPGRNFLVMQPALIEQVKQKLASAGGKGAAP